LCVSETSTAVILNCLLKIDAVRAQNVFSSDRLSPDPRSNATRRHHVDESGLQKAVIPFILPLFLALAVWQIGRQTSPPIVGPR
jgi:hypothetical protein